MSMSSRPNDFAPNQEAPGTQAAGKRLEMARGSACPTWLEPLGNLLLGTERLHRLRIARSLTAAYVYFICMLILMRGITLGMVAPVVAWALIGYMVTGVTVFYVLLRSGWSRRCKEPGLALAQSVFAISAIVVAYIITGPARGTVLLLLALVLVFGMFTLTPRQTLGVGAFALGTLGIAMTAMSLMHPEEFPVQLQAIQFGLAVSVLPTMALVAHQVSQLRMRLLRQRQALHEALARVQELATRDALTGLINRRHMQELLDQEMKRQERSGSVFCVALLDLDFFKSINDTHGHQVGDEVLCGFVQNALEVLRNADVMARWGGEEFLVLFPETRAEQAMHGLERLREQLVGRTVTETVPDLQVNFSAGLAEHHTGQTLRQTLERADRALYDAKARGRNRALLAPPPSPAR